ncbi:hypothetical protein N9Y92_01245 [Chlamydiales bacterium]|nr:hypothetical protein [Chlamydiales bacterium]
MSLLLLLTACNLQNNCIEPNISYYPQKNLIDTFPETFPPLTQKEKKTAWGKELLIGQAFGQEVDLYRSITALKRARILIPKKNTRIKQIDYSIILAYYLGHKYLDVICHFETSSIASVSSDFPGFHTLLTLLYECYDKTGECSKASAILDIINEINPHQVSLLQLGTAIELGQIEAIKSIQTDPCTEEVLDQFMECYCSKKKDPRTAKFLNAALPGAGYFYINQPQSALTSLLLNTLFIAATWQLFDRGYIAPAIFTLSLELGWYIGGINGAGLGAKEYNEALYNSYGKESMLKAHLFPILQINHAF